MLTTHPLLVPRLRKSRSYTSCHPDAPLWSVTGPLHLYFYYAVSSSHETLKSHRRTKPKAKGRKPNVTEDLNANPLEDNAVTERFKTE
jgi:hypothetical protein